MASTLDNTLTAGRQPKEGLMRSSLLLALHQTRFDLLSFVRNKQARFFTVMLPVLFLIIFVSVFGNKTSQPGNIKLSTFYVPGIAALAVISSSFVSLVMALATQRESGVLKRRRAAPVPAWVIIAGRTLTAIVIALFTMIVVLLIGRFAYGVHISVAKLPGLAITAVVGVITFCCLGFALTTAIKSADAAQPMVQAIMLPLYFISGIFIPNVNLPHWLQNIASVFPVEHLASGLHRAFDPTTGGIGIDGTDLLVMGAWALAGLIITLWRFSWVPAASAD